jgi:uncharacterized protein (TIRG00374 family)
VTEPLPPTRRSGRRAIALAIALGASAFFLYLSFRKVDFGDVWPAIAGVSIGLLSLSLPLRIASIGLAAVRSQVMLRPLHPYGLYRLFKSVLLASAVNIVIPFRVGDFARVGYLARYGDQPASTCLAVIAFERAMDLMALVLLLVCALPAIAVDLPLTTTFYLLVAAVVAVIVGAIIVSRHPAQFVGVCAWAAGVFGRSFRTFVEERAARFAHGLTALRSITSLIATIALSIGFWVLTALSCQLWMWAFGLSLPWYAPIVLLAFLSIGMAVPSSPGHIGTYHFFTITAMTTLGVSDSAATSFAIVAHAMAVVPLTVLSIPLLIGDSADFSRARRAEATVDG